MRPGIKQSFATAFLLLWTLSALIYLNTATYSEYSEYQGILNSTNDSFKIETFVPAHEFKNINIHSNYRFIFKDYPAHIYGTHAADLHYVNESVVFPRKFSDKFKNHNFSGPYKRLSLENIQLSPKLEALKLPIFENMTVTVRVKKHERTYWNFFLHALGFKRD